MFLITLSYFGLFSLPGFTLGLILGVKQQRFLLSYSLSISVFTTACLISETSLGLTDQLANAYLVTLGLAFLVAALIRRFSAKRFQTIPSNSQSSLSISRDVLVERIGYPALLIGLFLGYIFTVGPYTELPSDVWQHLGHIKTELLGLKADSSNFRPGLFHGSYAHRLHALVALLFGADQTAIVLPGTIFSSITLILSFYFFFCWVLKDALDDSEKVRSLAFVSTILSFVSFGVDQFSYFRYYALAPSIIAYPLFLAATFLLVTGIKNQNIRSPNLTVAVIFGVFAGLIHAQELMFLLIFAAVYIPWVVLDRKTHLSSKPLRNSIVRLGILIIGSYFFTAVIHFFFDLPTSTKLDARFIELSFLPTAYGRLYILNPTEQFFGVLSVVGIVAYAGFALRYSQFLNTPYIIAVLIIPFVTVFNPFFLSILFQLTTPYHAWRILYLSPFSLVATIGVWYFISDLKTHNHRQIAKRLIYSLLFVALVIDTTALSKSPLFFRYLTLKATASNGLDLAGWPSLREFLNTLPGSTDIVTDSVTGYFINGATKHNVDNFKFHNSFNSVALDKVFNGGKAKHLMHPELKNRIFVLNLQDGPDSLLGSISQHWPSDILKVSKFYPPTLGQVIEANNEKFIRLWSAKNMKAFSLIGYDVDEIRWDTFK